MFWLLLFLVLLTLTHSKQVSSWEKVQLQKCLWAGEWGLRMAGTGPLRWGKPWKSELLGVKVRVWEEGCGNSHVDLRGLSLLPDSLGSFKDDVLLVEMRTSLNNSSVCALEPSGCIPLPSIVSTVRTKEPSSRSFQPHLNCGILFFHSHSFHPTLSWHCSARSSSLVGVAGG